LAFGDVHVAVETETTIVACAAEHGEEVEGLGVIRDKNDFVISVGANTSKHTASILVRREFLKMLRMIEAYRSSTSILPEYQDFTSRSRPRASFCTKSSGKKSSQPGRSEGRSSKSGWLHSFLSMPIALSGWLPLPRSRLLISGDWMKWLYRSF